MKKKKAPGPVLVVFGLLFAGAAVFFIGLLADQAVRQAYLVAVAQPVSATVISADIETVRTKKRSRFKPVVVYRYEIDGREYRNDRQFPVEDQPSFKDHADAEQVIKQFPIGGQITAFHDPLQPQDSFLIRQIDFEPYSGIIFVMLHFSVGLALVLFNIRRSTTAQGDVRRWGIVLVVWTAVGIIALIHYASVGGELNAFSGGFGAAYILVTMLLGWWWSHIGAKALREAPRNGDDPGYQNAVQ